MDKIINLDEFRPKDLGKNIRYFLEEDFSVVLEDSSGLMIGKLEDEFIIAEAGEPIKVILSLPRDEMSSFLWHAVSLIDGAGEWRPEESVCMDY